MVAQYLQKKITTKNCQTIFQNAAAFYIPFSSVWGFQFLDILTSTCYFDCSSHPSDLTVVSHCGFDLHFPDE